MSRHETDHRKHPEGNRLKRYVDVEKAHGQEGSNPAVKRVMEREAKRKGSTRLKEYTRIERGVSA